MVVTTVLAVMCAVAAAVSLAAYVMGLRRLDRLRPLATVAIFCSSMALWQIGMALLYGLGPGAHMNIVFGAAFMLLGAISQIAATFRGRRGEEARAERVALAPEALQEASASPR